MPDTAPTDEASFEEALEQLEAIVEAMESGDIPLSDLVSKFEEGNRYLKLCQKRLRDAELKIEKLKDANDPVGLEAFEEPME